MVNLEDQDEKDPSERMLREKLTCCPLNKNEAASHKLPSIIAWDQLILKRSMMMLIEVVRVMMFMLGSISKCSYNTLISFISVWGLFMIISLQSLFS